MNKRLLPVLVILLILSCSFVSTVFSQDNAVQKNNWLLGVLFKAEWLRDDAVLQIKKAENYITRAQYIIAGARQEHNAEAEKVAKDALTVAKKTKAKAEWKKLKAEESIATIRNALSKNLGGSDRQIKGFVTNYTGRADILKANGDTVPPENGFLEPGDKVITLNGTAEIQALDGRASAKIGPYSELVMKKDTPEEQALELLKGKAHIDVEKMDEYLKMLDEKLKKYKEDISNIPKDYEKFVKGLKVHAQKKFEVRTQGGGGAVRGTEFLVFEDNKTGTEIIVLEGSVEMYGVKGEKTIIVNAGNKGTVTKDGKLSEPEKIDISNLEKWWER